MNLDIYYNDGQTELSLNENNIEDLSVTEEINLISDALPINTATFTVTEDVYKRQI